MFCSFDPLKKSKARKKRFSWIFVSICQACILFTISRSVRVPGRLDLGAVCSTDCTLPSTEGSLILFMFLVHVLTFRSGPRLHRRYPVAVVAVFVVVVVVSDVIFAVFVTVFVTVVVTAVVAVIVAVFVVVGLLLQFRCSCSC